MASTISPTESYNVTMEMNISEDLDAQRLKNIANKLIVYASPPIILVGTIGNILAFVVLLKKNMRIRSIYFYLLLLSCADLSVLYVSALKNWVRFTFNWELIHESNFICKFFWFYLGVSLHMSAWLVVLVTVDRFVAVAFPLKAAIYCTTRRAAIASFVCLVLIVAYQAHLFKNVELQTFNRTDGGTFNLCGPLSTNTFMGRSFNYMKLVTYSVTPFIAVVVLNIAIIIKLRVTKFADTRRKATSTGGTTLQRTMSRTGAPENVNEVRRVTMLLLIVSFSWLFLSLPFTVISMVNMRGTSKYARAVFYLVKVLCFFLLWINHSINFFLYCLSGKKFRNEIYVQLCGRFVRRKKRAFKRDNTAQRTFRTSLSHPEDRVFSAEAQMPMVSRRI